MSGRLAMVALQLSGNVAVVLGVAVVVYAIARGDTAVNRWYARYTTHLDRSLRLLFLPACAVRIVWGQAAVILACLGLAFAFREPIFLVMVAMVGVAPTAYLSRKRAEHVLRLETQSDALVMGLANALKTVPSPIAAFSQVAEVLPSPMRLEIDRLLKEIRVGTTLEEAILNMSARLRSSELDTALSSVLIGLQVGGNLPAVLESSASAIREMSRLQGVVRTKTAEGRAQLWVLALFPFAICLALRLIDEDYFGPLQSTIAGTICVVVAMTFWLASLLTARKILKVDI